MLELCQGGKVFHALFMIHKKHVLDEGAKLGNHLQLRVFVEVVFL